jgi:thiol:disulfide interchange protein DsbD
VALYFLRTAVTPLQHVARPGTWYAALASGLIVVSLLGAWGHIASERRGAKHPERSTIFKLGSAPIAICGGFMLISWMVLPKAELRWLDSEAQGRQLAVTEHKPVIVDFGATWCGACNELTAHTFADAQVRAEAGRFVAIRVDASDDDNAQVAAVKDKYHVVGLPTVVVLDSEGQERVRFNEFVPAQKFLDAIQTVN